MITLKRKPLLMIVSAPSGAGKTTLCDRLVAEFDCITYSVSCTTRAPREGEIDGVSYHFLSQETFEARQANGDFLEHAVVHGNHYGTLKASVQASLESGQDVLMDIDVQGAQQIRAYLESGPDNEWIRDIYCDVFIAPPSMEDLQLRLWGRGKDDEAVIRRRLERAREELTCWVDYQYVIVNDRLEESYATLRSILLAERHKAHRIVSTSISNR